jgi:hypothetical protein
MLIIEKLVRWIFFGVFMALLPIAFKIIAIYLKTGIYNVSETLAQGELLIVASALCGAAVGELFGAPVGLKLAKIIVGGSAVIILIITSLCFAILPSSSAASNGLSFNSHAIEMWSKLMFAFSFIISSLCIVLSEL